MRKLFILFFTVFVIFLFIGILYARTVRNYDKIEDTLENIKQKLDSTNENLNIMSVDAAKNRYFDIIKDCYVFLSRKPEYSQLVETLEYLNIAFNKYSEYFYFVDGSIKTDIKTQSVFHSIVLDMVCFLEISDKYVQGLSSQILKQTIPLLSNSVLGRGVKRKLKNDLISLINNGDMTARFHAVDCMGKLIEFYPSKRIQHKLTKKIADLLSDKDMFIVGAVVKVLHGVLNSVEINKNLRDEIILNLINLYGKNIYYPVNSYLSSCLRDLISNEKDKWYELLSDVLRKHYITDRDSILSYIFKEEKY